MFYCGKRQEQVEDAEGYLSLTLFERLFKGESDIRVFKARRIF